MVQSRFGIFDVTVTFVSFFTLILDVGTDILVIVHFFLNGEYLWGGLMASFIILPLLLMNIISLKWHISDGLRTCHTFLPHVFLIAPVQRYLLVIHLGVKSWRTSHPRFADAALREMNDICILRLVNAFMESAPQLVLQLYFILLTPSNVQWMHSLSAASSLLSLAWSLTAYCDSLRLAYKTPSSRRFFALVLHCSWHLLMVAARVAALVAFMLVFHMWLFLFAGLHWLAMTIWISIKGTDFGTNCAERWLFRIVSGFIYIFVFLNLHDGPARSRMVPYFCLMLLENAALYAMWIVYAKHDYMGLTTAMPIVIFGGFLLGGLCLTIYYRWLHPSGPNYLFSVKATIPSAQHPNSRIVRMDSILPDVTSPQTMSVMDGKTLELSTDCQTPAEKSSGKTPAEKSSGKTPERTAGKDGSLLLTHLLNSSDRGALESAWQSGMNSSDSSSCSSLDEDECSMDEFNTTARSNLSNSMQKSQTFVDMSQSRLSVVTVMPRRVSGASHTQRPLPGNHSKRSDSGNSSEHQSNDCAPPRSPSLRSRHSNQSLSSGAPVIAPLIEHESISEEQEEPDSGRREAADGTEEVAASPREEQESFGSGHGVRRMSVPRVSFVDESVHVGEAGVEEPTAASATVTLEPEIQKASKETGRNGSVSPVGASSLWEEPQSQVATPSIVSYCSPNSSRQGSWLSRSLGCSVTPGTASKTHGKAEPDTPTSGCSRPGREALTSYPDLVESMNQDQHQQRLFDNNDSYDHAGGESMWIASPNTSNTSSSQSQDTTPKASLPSRAIGQRACHFGSDTKPAGVNASDMKGAQAGREDLPSSQSNGDPHQKKSQEKRMARELSSSIDMESSWSSMHVNADELSGLNNLQNLTPDSSLCSFVSNDQDDSRRLQLGKIAMTADSTPDSSYSMASALASPALSRSKSTSSIYHDFCTEGFPPTPLAGLKGLGLSRNSSWLGTGTPEIREPCYSAGETCLDYLNVDPAPLVEQEAYAQRYDPREVIIELLLDQLRRTRSSSSWAEPSRLSPLQLSYTRTSPRRFGQNVEPLRTTESLPQRRESYRSEFLRLKEAQQVMDHSSRYSLRAHQNSISEKYVSGQYRPPIVTQGQQNEASGAPHPVPHQGLRPRKDLSARTEGFGAVSHRNTGTRDEQQRLGPQRSHQADTRRRSMPVPGNDGLRRYFVGSDSPLHTQHWNTPAADRPTHHQLLQRYLSDNTYSNDKPMADLSDSQSFRKQRSSSSHQSSYDYAQKQKSSKMEKLELLTDFQECQALAYNDAFSHLTPRQPLQILDNSPSLSPNSSYQQPLTKKATVKKTPDLDQHSTSTLTQERSRHNSLPRTGQKGSSFPLQLHRQPATASPSIPYISNPPKHSSKTKSVDCLR